MKSGLQILPTFLLSHYTDAIGKDVEDVFGRLTDSPLSADTFSFYTSVSAVYSSRIEGEDIELDSYVKHKKFGAGIRPDHTRKTDDLYDAYLFAEGNRLTPQNIKKAHAIITRHVLQKNRQGSIRKGNMYVITPDGKIEYVAADPAIADTELRKLFDDIAALLAEQLSFAEVLFFAAMIHPVFVKIHPFEDGNGRTARLLEKWFMAEKLGVKSWYVQSEKYYYNQHQAYYNNIRTLGLEYDTLDYSKALPFLLMLLESITHEYDR